MYIETFNQVGQSKSALFMQLSISGIPPECAAFARTSIGVVVVCLVYMYPTYIVCTYVSVSYRFIWHSQWRTGNQLLMLFIYKDSSIELNVINMRTQTSFEGRAGERGRERVVRKEKYLSHRMLRISICFLRSINKH